MFQSVNKPCAYTECSQQWSSCHEHMTHPGKFVQFSILLQDTALVSEVPCLLIVLDDQQRDGTCDVSTAAQHCCSVMLMTA